MSRTGQRWRWVLFGLAAVLLAGFGVLSFGRRVAQREPYVGVEWTQAADGPTVALLDPMGPAARAGLTPAVPSSRGWILGDVIVKLDGADIATKKLWN